MIFGFCMGECMQRVQTRLTCLGMHITLPPYCGWDTVSPDSSDIALSTMSLVDDCMLPILTYPKPFPLCRPFLFQRVEVGDPQLVT